MSDINQIQIVHLDSATIGPSVKLNKPDIPHDWVSFERTLEDEVVSRLKDADVAITNKVAITKEMLAELPKLKMIAISATGYDKIDVKACHDKGIIVSNIRDYAQQTVPEHTFALILALRRSISAYFDDVRQNEWQKSEQFCFFNHPISDLKHSTLGILGSGSIGSEVIKIAEAFGMKVLKSARKGEKNIKDGYTSFEDVLKQADILTLHCPLNDETKDLIALPEFQMMAKKPLLINVSRGGLVNEKDLITALDEELISGAAFDVLTSEPPSDDHIIMKNLNRSNLIVTPHIAWASEQAMQTLWDQLIGHIEHFHHGKPRNTL